MFLIVWFSVSEVDSASHQPYLLQTQNVFFFLSANVCVLCVTDGLCFCKRH